MATTIIINAITHRAACTDALGEADLAVYDANIDRFFAKLAREAHAEGIEFEVDPQGNDGRSYRVRTASQDEERAAHEFMMDPKADFWNWYQ